MNKKVIVSQFGGPEVLALHETDIPSPKADEIIIKTAYIGVGAIDGFMRSGGLKEVNLQPPFTPGIEVSGWVQAAGKNVHDFNIGQPVAAMMLPDGGYANHVRAKAALSAPLPSEEQLQSAASIVNLTTAHLLFTHFVQLSSEDEIVVHGASGGLGTACLQLLKLLHFEDHSTATVRNAAKKVYALEMGCRTALTDQEFLGQTDDDNGQRYSVIVDPVGGDMRRASINALHPYGTLLAVGNVSGDYDSAVSSQALWLGGKTIVGCNLALFASLHSEKVGSAMRQIIDAWANGQLAPTPAKIFKLSEVQKAHEFLQSGKLQGRILLDARD